MPNIFIYIREIIYELKICDKIILINLWLENIIKEVDVRTNSSEEDYVNNAIVIGKMLLKIYDVFVKH